MIRHDRKIYSRFYSHVRKFSLGSQKEKPLVEHNDLDHLAGTWSEKEYREFQKKIADFETIDEKYWK